MIKVTSPQFEAGDVLPSIFTCDGEGVSPELHISNVPEGSKSLAVILDDPDAPAGTFTHWLVYNLSPDTAIIKENSLPAEAKVGNNSGRKQSYFPPCPPSGSHRYVFHVYALDKMLDFSNTPDRRQVDEAISGALIDSGELTAVYSRKN
ncbi:MAG: YbhB/YbcL family Raf kinase inhibitor-like protein [Candidatus Buchananbacteria bacterium]